MPLEGVITALVTPFKEGRVDEEGLRENICFQIEQGIDGLLILGSTGEGTTLTSQEQERSILIAVNESKGKIPVMVASGDSSTAKTIEKTKKAQALGADSALIIPPFYNKPSQEGIALHFKAITENSSLPIVLYNHPGRSGVAFELETILDLASYPTIIGIKEASGNVSFCAEMLASLPEHFTLFSGNDLLTLPLISLGAKGVISVLSNLMPKAMLELTHAALKGEMKKALETHQKLIPFFKGSEIENNPAAIKAMMNLLGFKGGELRAPLVPLKAKNLEKLKRLFQEPSFR